MSEALPRAIVRRIVKGKMVEVAASRFGGGRTSKDLPIHKDALVALSQSAKIFIHYLTAAANEVCRDSMRQTINAEDILRAVADIDFVEFIEPLKSALEGHRIENKSKKAAKKATQRKRKLEDGAEEMRDHADSEENGNTSTRDEEEFSNMEEDEE